MSSQRNENSLSAANILGSSPFAAQVYTAELGRLGLKDSGLPSGRVDPSRLRRQRRLLTATRTAARVECALLQATRFFVATHGQWLPVRQHLALVSRGKAFRRRLMTASALVHKTRSKVSLPATSASDRQAYSPGTYTLGQLDDAQPLQGHRT